ncbi:MFS transporter [Micromonospora zamorensis]|uniref:MFS transporter n=1 Tax=Micromonospora zamorensis TaxID=709883 RepID=UPI000C194A7A|nr:MFS transporter [Micromonospora zamorensis]
MTQLEPEKTFVVPADEPAYRYDPDELVTIRNRTMTKKRYLWVLLPVIYSAYFLANFDGAIAGAAGPVIMEVFGLAPDTFLYVTAIFGGVSILTSVLAGFVIDRFGRKRMFALALLGVGLFSGLTATVVVFWQYVVLRALTAVTESGIRGAQTILIGEEAPPRIRGRLQSASWAFLFLGAATGGLVASAVLATGNWRLLFLITFAPMLLVFFVTRYLRESPRFLALRDRAEGAGGATRRIEREAVRRLFSREHRPQTVAMMVFGFFCFSAGSFTTLVAPIYLVEARGFAVEHASQSVTVMFAFALLGNLPTGWLTDKVSPKYVMVLWEALAAVLVLPVVLADGRWPIYLAFAALGFFGINGVVAFAIYLTAAFPTEIRGTGLSVILVFVSLSGVVIPLVSAPLLVLGDSIAVPLMMLSFPGVSFLAALALRPIAPAQDIDEAAASLNH